MNNFKAISDIASPLAKALSLNGSGDKNKCDSKQEYDELSKILSGCEKDSEAFDCVQGYMIEFTTKDNTVEKQNGVTAGSNTQEGVGNINGSGNNVNITIVESRREESREKGSRIADILVGPSDTHNYSEVRRTINSDVDADTVMEFLRGYEDRRPDASMFTNGDHFFEELFREYNFDKKDETIKKMAQHLVEFFENNAQDSKDYAENVRSINMILTKSKVTLEDVKQLDQIYISVLGD